MIHLIMKELKKYQEFWEKNNKFYELKGSSLNVEMKYKLAKYLAQSNLFEVYYIIVDNKKSFFDILAPKVVKVEIKLEN